MTDFKAGDKVVVRDEFARMRWWTKGRVYTVNSDLCVLDNEGDEWPISSHGSRFRPAPTPDADGWYPMPKLKVGDPIPEWLLDEGTEFSGIFGNEFGATNVRLSAIYDGTITHCRPAPKTEIATTPDGKEYRITHDPDGSVKAEVV